jgi:hypothetical protein
MLLQLFCCIVILPLIVKESQAFVSNARTSSTLTRERLDDWKWAKSHLGYSEHMFASSEDDELIQRAVEKNLKLRLSHKRVRSPKWYNGLGRLLGKYGTTGALAGTVLAVIPSSSYHSAATTTLRFFFAACIFVQSFGTQFLRALSGTFYSSFFWYMAQLSINPLITKSITAGVLGVIGDYMAQGIDIRIRRHLNKNANIQHQPYDARRGFSIFFTGLCVSGPLMHLGYDLFEKILPINTATGASAFAAIAHVIADSVFLDTIFVATTFITTGIVEGYKPKAVIKQLRSDYGPTLTAGWVTSILVMPLEFVAFRYLPVTCRVLAVNFIDMIWDTVISFMAHRNRGHDEEHATTAPEEVSTHVVQPNVEHVMIAAVPV